MPSGSEFLPYLAARIFLLFDLWALRLRAAGFNRQRRGVVRLLWLGLQSTPAQPLVRTRSKWRERTHLSTMITSSSDFSTLTAFELQVDPWSFTKTGWLASNWEGLLG